MLTSDLKYLKQDFPGGPVAKTLCCQCRGWGQGTRSHVPQLRVHMSQPKIPCATAKTQHSQKQRKETGGAARETAPNATSVLEAPG